MSVQLKGKVISVCPHCGFDEYVVNVRMSGRGMYYTQFDGSEGDNTTLHDCLTYRLGKIANCGNCHQYLGRVVN